MPSFSPTIINNSTPAISVTASNVSYNEIKNSLGDYVYLVNKLYLFSNLLNQIKSVVRFQRYDVNGQKRIQSLTPSPSPYQYQNAIYYDTRTNDIILNGQSNLKFKLLPNAELNIDFYTDRVAKKDALDLLYPDNFKRLEAAMGDFVFFEDWQKQL